MTKICISWRRISIFKFVYLQEFDQIWVAEVSKCKSIYILLGAFFWNTGWYFLRVLTVFDEPLGESNTERQVKISASISKEGTW